MISESPCYHNSMATMASKGDTAVVSGSTMDIIRRACEVNNMGVAYLVNGRNSAACMQFKLALGGLQFLLQEYTANAEGGRVADELYKEDKSLLLHSNKELYVYDKPLILEVVASEGLVMQSLPLYCAVILFNMALMYDANMSNQNNPYKSMQCALNLYSKCLQMLELYQSCPVSAQCELKIVVLNNLAQLYLDICDYAQYRIFLTDLTNAFGRTRYSPIRRLSLDAVRFNLLLTDIGRVACSA
jgi:hypothetical protein